MLVCAGTGVDISGPSSVLQALGVLVAVVIIHEVGHFTAARIQGIHVTKFAIGFGPALFKYQVIALLEKHSPAFSMEYHMQAVTSFSAYSSYFGPIAASPDPTFLFKLWNAHNFCDAIHGQCFEPSH